MRRRSRTGERIYGSTDTARSVPRAVSRSKQSLTSPSDYWRSPVVGRFEPVDLGPLPRPQVRRDVGRPLGVVVGRRGLRSSGGMVRRVLAGSSGVRWMPPGLSIEVPKRVRFCVARKVRRGVLFALRKAGYSGSGPKKHYRRDAKSQWRC